MLKSIVCFCFFALVATNAVQLELNDKIRHFLAEVKSSDLPESVRLSLSRNQDRAAGEATHWCCINEQPIQSVTGTKVEHGTKVVMTKVIVGYVDCGFMGTMKCPHHVTQSRVEIYTYIQTFQVPHFSACKSEEIKCCSGYMNVAGNCHSTAELIENQELIQFLHGLGLLFGGIGK
ncbi:unnamed protein product [Adineta steineri]|uniref:Uncharacterized protein n=1 Tax=Adineta steineri TaxID=433720 RepID=A0A815QBN3_9BILA|nr:unnamed protein product [Adineta steineri]